MRDVQLADYGQDLLFTTATVRKDPKVRLKILSDGYSQTGFDRTTLSTLDSRISRCVVRYQGDRLPSRDGATNRFGKVALVAHGGAWGNFQR